MKWIKREINKEKEVFYATQSNNKLINRLLAQRNVKIEDVDKFLESPLSSLGSPFDFPSMKEAVDLFVETYENNGHVAIIGDYDADGITSSTMLHELCFSLKLTCEVFLPNRFEHGYGLNDASVKTFKEIVKTPPDLLIIVDCGTNNFKEIEELREFGIKKIIIIDHHTPDMNVISKNADALVSWMLGENLNEMCSAGQVFHFIRGLRTKIKKVAPIEYLTYAAIGTLSDVSPVVGDNRIIVKYGLKEFAIKHVVASGLSALFTVSRIDTSNVTQYDIEFQIGPRLNAVGRLDSPNHAFDTLVEKNYDTALQRARALDDWNKKRKDIQKQITTDALDQVKTDEEPFGVVAINKDWNVGVVGIVASRLVESHYRPALVIGYHKDQWKGSGRSVEGVHIKQVLDDMSHVFEKYGGHAGACGATVKNEMIEELSKEFNKSCKKYCEQNNVLLEPVRYYDIDIRAKHLNFEIFKTMYGLYPFCKQNNPTPVFRMERVKIKNLDFRMPGTYNLLTFDVEQEGITLPNRFMYWRSPYNYELEGQEVTLYFSLSQKFPANASVVEKFEISCEDIVLESLD